MADNKEEKLRFFSKADLVELLLRNGLVDNENVHLERGVS